MVAAFSISIGFTGFFKEFAPSKKISFYFRFFLLTNLGLATNLITVT